MPSTKIYGPTRVYNYTIAAETSGALVQTLPAQQVVTTTSETQIVDPGVTADLLLVNIPPGGPLEQRAFDLLISGYVTVKATTSNVTVSLYEGSSSTISSNKKLASTGAVSAVAVGTYPFQVKCGLIYDSVSGKLDGYQSTQILDGEIAGGALSTTSPISLSISNSANPVLQFSATVTFGTSNSGNLINVQEFCVSY